jgi:predicted O-methyltransferase YrrM
MHQIIAYIKYWFKAGSRHGLHSPLVYELLDEVLKSQKNYYAFDEIKHIKKQLLESKDSIEQIEHGAGSKRKNTQQKPIAVLAKTVSIPNQQGEWLFNLVRYFKPCNVLELGTCIGMSTLYMALEDTNRKIFTIEGNPDSAALAGKIFAQLQLKNIEQFVGKFEDKLEDVLKKMQQLGFAFIDGNHRYSPTIEYFNAILPFCNEQTVLVFHDIHWSKEMEKAWNEIAAHQSVSISIDYFYIGIIIFRKGIIKQHFILK